MLTIVGQSRVDRVGSGTGRSRGDARYCEWTIELRFPEALGLGFRVVLDLCGIRKLQVDFRL
jgi:hypothetical protein